MYINHLHTFYTHPCRIKLASHVLPRLLARAFAGAGTNFISHYNSNLPSSSPDQCLVFRNLARSIV